MNTWLTIWGFQAEIGGSKTTKRGEKDINETSSRKHTHITDVRNCSKPVYIPNRYTTITSWQLGYYWGRHRDFSLLRTGCSGKYWHLRRKRRVISQVGYYMYTRYSVICRSIGKRHCCQDSVDEEYTQCFVRETFNWKTKKETGGQNGHTLRKRRWFLDYFLLLSNSRFCQWRGSKLGGFATRVTQADSWLVKTHKFLWT